MGTRVGVYDPATGALLTVQSTESTVPAGALMRPLPDGGVAFETHDWDVQAKDWIARGPQTTPILSRLAFRWRYTLAEQVAIQVAESEHADPKVRATLSILRQSLAEAETIDVTDQRTQQGVYYHASLGLIAPSRITEILALQVAT